MVLGVSCVVRVWQVADIADVVRQRADCLMLSGESAVGAYPDKAVGVLRAVATRIEEWCRSALLINLLHNRPINPRCWQRTHLTELLRLA